MSCLDVRLIFAYVAARNFHSSKQNLPRAYKIVEETKYWKLQHSLINEIFIVRDIDEIIGKNHILKKNVK